MSSGCSRSVWGMTVGGAFLVGLALFLPMRATDLAAVRSGGAAPNVSARALQRVAAQAVLAERQYESGQPTTWRELGCVVVKPPHGRAVKRSPQLTRAGCAQECADQGYRLAGLVTGDGCWCAERLPADTDLNRTGCKLACVGDEQTVCGGLMWHSTLLEVTSALRQPITVYIAPAKRTSSLFSTGVLDRYATGRYIYRYQALNVKLTKTPEGFREQVCRDTPGMKVFVQVAGAMQYILQHFPDRSILVLTADENTKWGLGEGDIKRHGPHGQGGPFPTNESSPLKHILLPPRIFPLYKQYYSSQQWQAFGPANMRFLPLGARHELPPAKPGQPTKTVSQRKYVYAYVVALTHGARHELYRELLKDDLVPVDKRFVHVSNSWHARATHADYVQPEEYAAVLQDSVFVLCPQGHNIEQFRIYEALEAGAIPVLRNVEGYTKGHLPPSFLSSPLVFVDSWEEVVPRMVELMSNPEALARRAKDLALWYDTFMRGLVAGLEADLEARTGTEFCGNAKPAPSL